MPLASYVPVVVGEKVVQFDVDAHLMCPTSALFHIRNPSLGLMLMLLGLFLGNMPLERPRHTAGPFHHPTDGQNHGLCAFPLIPLSPPYNHHCTATGSQTHIHDRLLHSLQTLTTRCRPRLPM